MLGGILQRLFKMDVVSARYHFKYFYEITRIDDSAFSYTAWIRFPVSNNIVLIDELPAGEYRARRVGYIQVGVAEHQYGSRSVPFGQPFTLERGKMVIFPQSLRLTMRNENPGHFATIIYNHSLQPTSREQKDAIEAVLKKQGNFALWEFQDS
jgi:hypothetical protein